MYDWKRRTNPTCGTTPGRPRTRTNTFSAARKNDAASIGNGWLHASPHPGHVAASALDVLSAESLRGELLELWTGGKIPTRAILMVTHNIEEAIFMADRVVLMDKAPGHVVSEVKVELPHPRDRKGTPFLAAVDRVYATLAGQTEAESVELGTAPGEPGRTRALPDVGIDDLAGLL